MATTMFSSRLPAATMEAIEARANKRGSTKSEALASLVDDALDMRGRDGLESRIAVQQAIIEEQERIIKKQTGKPTPRTKRLSVGVTLAEAAAIDKAARQAGMTRSEYLRSRIVGDDITKKALPGSRQPALPPGDKSAV